MDTLTIRNAAGTARTLEDVARLCNSAVTDIVVGSITLNPRRGNSGQTTGFNEKSMAYANALNMPNVGMGAFLPTLPFMVQMAHDHDKKLVVSVAGTEPAHYGQMALGCYLGGADLVEYNFGCSNSIELGGMRNPVPSQDPGLSRDILTYAKPFLRRLNRKIGVKISPVEPDLLSSLTDVLLESGVVEEVSACNTIGGKTLLLEDGSCALSYRVMGEGDARHDGGLSGAPLKEKALPIVDSLTAWQREMRVVALGGIFCGEDALSYFESRAAGFGCGAAYMVYGPKIFGDIAAQLSDHL